MANNNILISRLALSAVVPWLIAMPSAAGVESVDVELEPFRLLLRDGSGSVVATGVLADTHPEVDSGIRFKGRWTRFEYAEPTTPRSYRVITDDGTTVSLDIEEGKAAISVRFVAPHGVERIGYAFGSPIGEQFFGVGSRFLSLDQRGRRIPDDDPKYAVSLPVLLSSRGYGLYLETEGAFAFDLAKTDPGAFWFSTLGSTLTFHVVRGADPMEVVRSFTALAGRPRRPPPAQLGVWKWRDWVFDELEVYEDASMMRSLDIPASVLMIDSPWSTEYNTYEFNPRQFPDPRRMIDTLHRMGYRVVLWTVPIINPASPNFTEAEARGYFAETETGDTALVPWWNPSGSPELGLDSGREGALIDFTNLQAVQWWQEQVAKVLALGVDGFKLDDGEMFFDDIVLSDGRRGADVKHLWSGLYHRAVAEIVDEYLGDDAILMARAAVVGSQRHITVYWPGDQTADFDMATGLPSVIISAQSSAISGFPVWTSDTGGYDSSPSPEVFARWLEMSALSPVMQVGGKSHHEPWLYNDVTESVFRRYAQLHTHLRRYLEHLVDEAVAEGSPIVRALFLEFPDDPRSWNEPYEYLLGPDLLVAPVYQAGTSRSVYLPPGRWLDFWGHQLFEGPTGIEAYPAPLDTIPLFVRVSPDAVPRLVVPLLEAQLDGFADRVRNHVLRGVKKLLITEPYNKMEQRLASFEERVAEVEPAAASTVFHRLLAEANGFRGFLAREEAAGGVSYHVRLTLDERLSEIERTARAVLKLRGLLGIEESDDP
jgi:alpha-glucosidase (family GH31 glycosyl hydrolase)